MARGELGHSKVRALTRIATPGNEPDLLEIGLHGTAQHVEKFVRLYRQARRAGGRHAQLEPQPPAGAGSLPSSTGCSS